MCPIIGVFAKAVNNLNMNTAESSERIGHVGRKFEEVDPGQAPPNNLFFECLSNDPMFFEYQKKYQGNAVSTTLSSLMTARQQARSTTPSSKRDQNSRQLDDQSYASRPRSKTPQKKPSIFEDFTGFLDDPSIDEFSQNFFGDKNNPKKQLVEKTLVMDESSVCHSRKTPSMPLEEPPSYLSNRKTPTKPVDEKNYSSRNKTPSKIPEDSYNYDRPKSPSKNADQSSFHGKGKTTTRQDNSVLEDGKYRSYLNETAISSKPINPYTNPKHVESKVKKLFSQAEIPDDEYNVETQRKMLEEIEKKHKESQRKKADDQARQSDYFSSNRNQLQPPDNSRSNLNKTSMDSTIIDGSRPPIQTRNYHNTSDVLLDPPSILEQSKAKPTLPFSEFLDCKLR